MNRNKRLAEFLDKVDTLCWEYSMEILPRVNDDLKENEIPSLIIRDTINEIDTKIIYIDGDGRGK